MDNMCYNHQGVLLLCMTTQAIQYM